MEFDHDFIIVGSGFGGSVSALRLAEKGYKVAVLPGSIARAACWGMETYLRTLRESGSDAEFFTSHAGAKEIGAWRTGESRVIAQFRSKLVGRGVNLVRINAADDVGIATELTADGTDVDLQHRLRIHRWQNAGNAAARLP